MSATTTAIRTATGTAAFGVSSAPRRCGSYPLMNLAEDFGVAYGDVLTLSMAVGAGVYGALSEARRQQVDVASARIWRELGDQASHVLYARLKAVLGR